MAEEDRWKEGEYHFQSDREGIPLESESSEENIKGEPVVKESHDFDRMHPDFPETHGYLKKSLSDLDFTSDRIRSMKSEKAEEEQRDKPVDIKRRREPVDHEVSIESLRTSPEFKRRKIINKARVLVKRSLLSKGYSKEFIREHKDMIDRKVEEFLKD